METIFNTDPRGTRNTQKNRKEKYKPTVEKCRIILFTKLNDVFLGKV
jgi:hypothetical protein